MPKLKKRTIYIFILAVIVLYVVIAVIPSVTGKLTRTESVKTGELKVSDQETCYIIRDETVYTAASDGKVSFSRKEGTLVKKGAKVMSFKEQAEKKSSSGTKTSTSDYAAILNRLGKGSVTARENSLRKGIISYYVDGYETFFAPDTMTKLSSSEVKDVSQDTKNVKRTKVLKGDPLFKICDNANWYICFWIRQSDISNYEEGNSVTVELGDEDIPGTVYDISQEGSKWRIIVRTNRYYSEFTSKRKMDGKIVTTDVKGLIVDNGCITTKKKKVGVYVKNTTGGYDFVQVNVLATDGKKSALSSEEFTDAKGNAVKTVEAYDEILKDPS